MPLNVLFITLNIVMAQAASPADIETDVAFVSRLDNTEQRYVLWQPDSVTNAEERPVIVALHGHGADRWQFIREPRDECRATRDAAREHGMMVLSPDYRAKTSWMGPAAEADVAQILEEYRAIRHPSHVLLCGGSMGAASALTFAALHPGLVDGVVAMNPVANHLEYEGFQDAITASFGGSKQEKTEEYKNRSAEYWPERFTMPVALTIGEADEATPPQSTIRLAAVLKTLERPILLISAPGGGHATDYQDARAALEFVIEKILGTTNGHR